MRLSKKILSTLDIPGKPADKLFDLPEKVLQFGTGVFLRGLPDYVIDKANKQGIFNGRVLVVKSTGNGKTDAFSEQDGLYTLLERGMEDGAAVERTSVNAAISRVLSANEDWEEILESAANAELQVIISNTTEVGIVLVEDDAGNTRPVSFPGRLLAFLEKRFEHFAGSMESGMVIVPTELIVNNGDTLKAIVLTLAKLKGSSHDFISWIMTANDFCNSLVDRIVPGRLSAGEHLAMEKQLGYTDELMIMAEPYCLWAVETDQERTKNILSFSQAEKGVILTPDINKFRELKLRLLNGAHTFSCGIAYLMGFATVKQAMQDRLFPDYLSSLMMNEIVPLLANEEISTEEAQAFATQVLDRFSNPYVEHQWSSIAAQYTSKMGMRTAPLVVKHYSVRTDTPELMALGFAAHILFSRPATGPANGKDHSIPDDKATILHRHWQSASPGNIAVEILNDPSIYGQNLAQYNSFAETVQLYLSSLIQHGALATLESLTVKQTTV